MSNINIALIEAPTASLRINGERVGTDRIRTPIPTQPVLLPSLDSALKSLGYEPQFTIVNMKADNYAELHCGDINLGDLTLGKFVLGSPFEFIDDVVAVSDIVGLTSNFTYSSRVVREVVSHVKRVNPHAKVIVGGSDASVREAFYLDAGADVVIRGEGEHTGPLVIDALLKGKTLDDIARLSFRKGSEIVRTIAGRGDIPVHMNSLPLPALNKVDIRKFVDTGEGPLIEGAQPPIWAYETSRGCKQVCSFCTTPFLKPGYRAMSLDRISKLFDYLIGSGVKVLISNEDNPLSRMHGKGEERDLEGRTSVIEYGKLIRRTNLPFEWANGLEIGKLADKQGTPDIELIESLLGHAVDRQGRFLSGVYRCYVPLETLSDEGIRRLRKLRPYDTELEILKAIASTKIPMLNFGVIVGTPYESPASVAQIYQRCEEIKTAVSALSPATQTFFNFFMYAPLPGTPEFRREQHRFVASIDSAPELWSFYVSCIQGDHYSAAEMARIRRKMSMDINGRHAMKVYDEQ